MFYAGTSKTTANTFLTLESDLISIHNGRYTYENAVFINARTPFLITCKEHGDFLQQPRAHKQGQGCRKCFDEHNTEVRRKDKSVALEELEEAIGDRFIIDTAFEYTNSNSIVCVTCKTCNSSFNKSVALCIYHKSNCSECKKRESTWGSSRYEGSPAILYYIKVGGLYKIGITKNSVATRYKKELASGLDIEVIFTIEYSNGIEAFKEEQRILKDYAMFRYYGDKVLMYGGDSELFTVDIFNKEYNNEKL